VGKPTLAVSSAVAFSSSRTNLLLFLAGINLMLLQLFLIREFAITLFCTELVLLAITVAYFSGYSIGYWVSPRIDPSVIWPWLVSVVLLHLPMIAGVRVIGGWLDAIKLRSVSMPLICGIAALCLTSFYTIFLPRAVASDGGSARSLARCYSLELAGSATGLALVLAVGRWWRFELLAVIYQTVLLAIAWCLGAPRRLMVGLTAGAVAVLVIMPVLDLVSTEYFYNHFYSWLHNARALYRVHSPYQKIEVLETTDGGRSLYLNGLEYFNTDDLEQFNFYLSEVPARLKPGASVLVVGSGSMSSLSHLAPHASQLTTVEIDAAVVDVGRRFFADYNQLDQLRTPWRLVIDDAKHFLSTTTERFDLVIVDVPAPWYVQTGLLFTREFYQLVKGRLNEGGVLSVYLTESISLGKRKRVSSQILAALIGVFDNLYVVNAKESPYGFAMAGDRLPFDTATIADTIRTARPRAEYQVYDRAQMRELIGDAPAASFDNLGIVWDLNLWALPYKWLRRR